MIRIGERRLFLVAFLLSVYFSLTLTFSFTTFVTELPTHGKLVYVNGLGETVELEQFNQYNPHGDNVPLFQYASER